jgi:hypothetical protein
VSARAKLVLAVIDGMAPAALDRAREEGRAPTLSRIAEEGHHVSDCVSAFPSVTPVCAASIATGVGPDRHHIPSMNWYHRADARYVEYGSSFQASRTFGIARSLTDTIYNMNLAHLSRGVNTVFESLDDAGVRTAGTTFLMYRGRHRHAVASESALARLVTTTLFRQAVYGPREFFYADLFASRRTGCRSQLGLPGARDAHAGCVGSHLAEHDLFDFLLLSLPDNDTASHRRGPEAQVESIAAADAQIQRVMEAAGGVDEFLSENAVVVLADHSHSLVEETIGLRDRWGELRVLEAQDPRPEDAEIAVCPGQRSAMIYVLDTARRTALAPELAALAVDIDGVDLALWLDGEEAVASSVLGELRFAPGGDATDARGERWRVSGELDVLDLRIRDGTLRDGQYPDALSRAWSGLRCPTAGDVLLSAAPGCEFLDWGGVAHVGGGSHGSLHANDSLAPLLWCGTRARPESRSRWALRDVTPMVLEHFAV